MSKIKAKFEIGEVVKVKCGIFQPFNATVVAITIAENIVTSRDEINYVIEAHDDGFKYHAKEEWLNHYLND